MSESDCTHSTTLLSDADTEALVRGICFKTGPPRTLGVELEWLVRAVDRPHEQVSRARLDELYALLRTLPLHSALTVEPGGQLELSSAPAPALTACVTDVASDLATVRAALRPLGLALVGVGTDPWCGPVRWLRAPRYAAMETYLDRAGPAGRMMMCSSASVQVCVDAGYEEPGPLGLGRRWRLAHLLGPVLVAAFANSPLARGRLTGWRSTRQALWADIEPGRSAAPPLGAEPRAGWARRVLDAPVMCVRTEEGPWLVPDGLTFRSWIRGGLPRPPTRSDLDYHISTLFPPVRPRGHLELRMIDAQPGEDGWIVPLAVTAALFDDTEAAETAYRCVKSLSERDDAPAPGSELWLTAAREALGDPELREAAGVCFDAALSALPRLGASAGVTSAVAAYADRFVHRGRCPADESIEGFAPRGKDPSS
ncbi:ergothioneine biosynthesis glutamate--cysteine ligase EgtA [Streptomyces sp. NPDC002490]|uniref:ergothioneine biosynthesis glutamate--cysteine ligase EgtA n=1 Tax=Streptomyces sp. NPDC002490 TaxID=3154416 RepID=UPI00332C9458